MAAEADVLAAATQGLVQLWLEAAGFGAVGYGLPRLAPADYRQAVHLRGFGVLQPRQSVPESYCIKY